MNYRLAITLLIFISSLSTVLSQSVGINTLTPDASSVLDVQSTTKGLLIPRMSTAQRTTISTPAVGLMVYDTTTQSFWYYKSSGWMNTLNAGTGWATSGNAIAGSEFIGTTSNQPLIFKTNNLLSGHVYMPLPRGSILQTNPVWPYSM